MADVNFPSHVAGVTEKFVDQGDGTHARGVAIVGLEGDVTIEGDAVVDTSALEALFGPLDATAETDPDAASATVTALLRGILAELQAQTVLLTTIAGE
jgi:hypothetical protein